MLRTIAVTMAAGAALAVAMPAAQAAEDAGQAYVKLMGTHIFSDDDRNVDDEIAGGLIGFGYALSDHFNIEVDIQSLSLDGLSGFRSSRILSR